jgi:hypothetical protein
VGAIARREGASLATMLGLEPVLVEKAINLQIVPANTLPDLSQRETLVNQ